MLVGAVNEREADLLFRLAEFAHLTAARYGFLYRIRRSITVDDAIVQQPEQKPVNRAGVIRLSREDEVAIRALADELHAPREIIAEVYGHELEPLHERRAGGGFCRSL
jgi:hypothetical protein